MENNGKIMEKYHLFMKNQDLQHFKSRSRLACRHFLYSDDDDDVQTLEKISVNFTNGHHDRKSRLTF